MENKKEAKKKAKGKTGTRYSPEQRTEIIDYVKKHDTEHNGRGGMAAAQKKFNVSYLTIRNWMESKGESKQVRRGRGRPPGKVRTNGKSKFDKRGLRSLFGRINGLKRETLELEKALKALQKQL